jgi:hypothetical protein
MVKYGKEDFIPQIIKEIGNSYDQIPYELSKAIHSFNNMMVESAINDNRYDIALKMTETIGVPLFSYQDIFKIITNISKELRLNDNIINNKNTSTEDKEELEGLSEKMTETMVQILFDEKSLMSDVDMDDFINFINFHDDLHPRIDTILKEFMKYEFNWTK